MKEQNFDQYLKSVLHDAEVEVSPALWAGIAAKIGAPKAAAPVWGWWALASVAAAVAAFIVFRYTPSSPAAGPSVTAVAADASFLHNRVQPVNAEDWIPVQPQPRLRRSEAIASARLDARVEGRAQQPLARMRSNVGADKRLPSRVDDTYLLNQLAFSARQEQGGEGLSLLASANFQGNERGQVNGVSYGNRAYMAPPAGAEEGIYNETPETSFRLPFSIGLGLRYSFDSRWALGTGIRYTNLGRTFMGDFVSKEGIAISQTDIDNQQHWLGVPLNVYYDIVNRGRWRVHSFLGGAFEYLVVNDFLIHYAPKDLHYTQRGTAPQWSVAAGLGVEFRLTPRMGIYMDPNVRYYFESERQPRSLRTIQPLRFDIEAGVRFTFGGQ